MREPLQKPQGGYRNFSRQGYSNSVSSSDSGSHSNTFNKTGANGNKGRRTDYCREFNRQVCTNKHCRWINKCRYCDSTNHRINACPKLEKKDRRCSEGNSPVSNAKD